MTTPAVESDDERCRRDASPAGPRAEFLLLLLVLALYVVAICFLTAVLVGAMT